MRARHLQLLAGITLAGALLRFSTLHVQSYWLDEVATVNVLHKSFGGMISGVASGESTPPLYYILAWLWAKLFGTGEVGLRSLSALFGTATIPVAFALARRIAGRRAGLIAAAIAAFNPLLVWYSQEARSYALLVLLTGLGLIAFLRALDQPSRRNLAHWAVLGIAALATHYYAGFLLGAEAAWLLWRTPARKDAAVAAGALAACAAALLPLALHQRSSGGANFIGHSSLARRLAQIPKQFLVGYEGPAQIALTIAAALLVAYALAHVVANRRALVLAGVAVAAVAAALVLALIGPDYLIARNVIASALPLAAVVAAGLAAARGGVLATVALCAIGLVVAIAVDTNERYQRDDWRGAADFLANPDQPRAIIVTPAAGSIPLLHYLKRSVPTPAGGEDVKELVFVGLASRTAGEAPKPPRPPQVGAAGFSETRRKQAGTYTVVVERSPAGAHIMPTVGASSLDGQPARTLYQP